MLALEQSEEKWPFCAWSSDRFNPPPPATDLTSAFEEAWVQGVCCVLQCGTAYCWSLTGNTCAGRSQMLWLITLRTSGPSAAAAFWWNKARLRTTPVHCELLLRGRRYYRPNCCSHKATYHYSSQLQTWLQIWFSTRFAARFAAC